jgi:hypothetical protein
MPASHLRPLSNLCPHTVARSDTLEPDNHTAVPFDFTPFAIHSQFFLEVLLKGATVPFRVNNTDGVEVDSGPTDENEMRLQSELCNCTQPKTSCF